MVQLCFHANWIMQTDWKHIDLDMIRGIRFTPYFCVSLIVSVMACVIASILYYRYRYDAFKKRLHRQKLAKMILENGWYEIEVKQDTSFIKGMPSGGKKESISWFPKIYYRMKDGQIRIQVEISLGKYQDQLLHLEKKLESGLYCELTDKVLLDSFVEYTLLYDMIGDRIGIDEVRAENGALQLMKNVWWKYDSLPHMLIAGGTGSGKTCFIQTMIRALLQMGAVIYVLDPKNSDLADLSVVMPNVYHKKEDMVECLKQFYEDMLQQSGDMKQMKGYKTGNNYADLGLPAHFLIFDEYVAFMEMLGNKENVDVLSYLKQIVMLGRQAGFFLILACQRPDAKYLGDGIRDQFNFRVALGRNSELGYSMMFGEADKDFFLKTIKGRGYVDAGTGVISEFYTPLVPKGYDFLAAIKELHMKPESKMQEGDGEGEKEDAESI